MLSANLQRCTYITVDDSVSDPSPILGVDKAHISRLFFDVTVQEAMRRYRKATVRIYQASKKQFTLYKL